MSFKGARNVRKVFDVLHESLGSDFVDSCLGAKSGRSTTDASTCVGRRDKRVRNDKPVVVASSSTALVAAVAAPVMVSNDMYPGFFGVHMAVVTLCLGKRLSVSTGNSMEMHVHRVLGVR